MAISRRNKQFVQEVDRTTPLNLNEKVHKSITDAKNGRTAGELEVEFKDYNPRSIRYAVRELVTSGLVENDTKCRCHSTTIYYVK